MQKKITIISIILTTCILILVILKIFIFRDYNLDKNGNNSIIQLSKNNILSMESYEAEVTVQIENNKNANTYVLKQKFIAPNLYKQEVVEPTSIANLTISYDGKDLKIQNTQLNLNEIYENYMYIGGNYLMLNRFVEEYKNSKESKCYENDTDDVYETKLISANQYAMNKKLYVDKETNNPRKLEIQDINQKTMVYILYNKVEINSLERMDL